MTGTQLRRPFLAKKTAWVKALRHGTDGFKWEVP